MMLIPMIYKLGLQSSNDLNQNFSPIRSKNDLN